jgi:transcription elongation factor Elf1
MINKISEEKMYCPICDKEHIVPLMENTEAEYNVKCKNGNIITLIIPSKYYVCDNVSEDNTFVNGAILNSELETLRKFKEKIEGEDIVPYNFHDNDIPKHKKKSQGKKTPRSDHKHNYIDVALVTLYDNGKLTKTSKAIVCEVCGRIKSNDWFGTKSKMSAEELEKNYPIWYRYDYMDMKATRKPNNG